MKSHDVVSRRKFIGTVSIIASGAMAGALPMVALADEKNANKVGVEEVSPVEDLMREHGGLNRILLIYDEALRRFHAKEDFDPALLKGSAGLIHDFIEGYHEKLEEEHIFPKLKKAGRLADTVDILIAQHKAGRKLTETILSLSTAGHFKDAKDKEKLESALAQFIRMYRPHEAREDTIVFPEFKKTLTPKEYDQLGDVFEEREHELFGKEGFDGIVVKIAKIEKALGIYDLSKFTPKV
jgi:hemerythrin-like domain-containing protein